MKKNLLAIAFLFFAGFSHAATLQISVEDAIDKEVNLNGDGIVKITLSENPAKKAVYDDVEDFIYKITDYTPTDGQVLTITKEGYISQTGTITLLPPIISNAYSLIYTDNTGGTPQPFGSFTITTKDVTVPDGVDENGNTLTKIIQETVYTPDTYTLPDIQLLPNPDVIISGTITAVRGEGEIEQELIWDKVEIFASENGNSLEVDDKTVGEYSVIGYLGTEENPRYLTVVFKYAGYKDIEETFTIEEEIKDKENIKFKEKTISGKQQENLAGITGFGCNETMPKYLVGANCEENRTLEGDATDLAVFIQKFGGKITGMISMIAVVLIVWNGFTLVTALGDTEKISQAKKGIMWTIIGLAVTMFAYIIVKTVIVMTYTK